MRSLVELLFILGTFRVTSTSLLDVSYPLIFQDPHEAKAERSSYFGFSSILFTANNASWMIVGAPRGNCTWRCGSKEPGKVFRCRLDTPVTGSKSPLCQQLVLYENEFEHTSSYVERRDGSWLGGVLSLHRKSGIFAACAPRWSNTKIENEWTTPGSCYTADISDLSLSPHTDKHIPLLDHYTYSIGYRHVTIYDYAQAEGGFSSCFSDDTKGRLQLALGAPGVLNWRGSAVLLSNFELPGHLSKRDITNYNLNNVVNLNFVNNNDINDASYLGYSITSGRYYADERMFFASGAPRGDNYLGKVLIFEFPLMNRYPPSVRQILSGLASSEVGGYFGATLASGDINGDGFSDLLVAAPYLVKPKVFIFLGSKQALLAPTIGPQYFEAETELGPKSLYGIAIATADLDVDGYEDVIIGAPGSTGGGAVMIYLGSNVGPSATPAQVIMAQTLNAALPPSMQLRGFGNGLAQPTDIDGNSFPDLAIGAFMSDHVAILRGRPRTRIVANLEVRTRLQRNTVSFELYACIHYLPFIHPAKPAINVERTLIIDPTLGRAFYQKNLSTSSKYTSKVPVNLGAERCDRITIFIRKDIKNFLSPIEMFMNITILDYTNETKPVIITGTGVEGEDRFDRYYPRGDKGASSTAQLSLPFATDCGNDNICEADLHVNGSFPDLKSNTFVLGSTESVRLLLELKNHGEPAYLAQLRVVVPRTAGLLRLPPTCRIDPPSASFPLPTLLCELANPLRNASTEILVLEIDMRGVTELQPLTFEVMALTKSKEINTADNALIVLLNFSVEARVAIAGKSLQDSYAYMTEDKKSLIELVNFKHLFEVQKFGASPVDEALIVVKIPYMYEDGNGNVTFVQIYRPEGSQSGQPFSCENTDFEYAIEKVSMDEIAIPDDEQTLEQEVEAETVRPEIIKKAKRSARFESSDRLFHPLFTTLPNVGSYNLRRHKREIKLANDTTDDLKNRTVHLGCGPNEDGFIIHCHEVRCLVGPFRRSQNVARLLMTMALNITTLKRSIMGKRDILVVESSGLALLEGQPDEGGSTRVRSVFVSSPHKEKRASWIIPVAVAIGVFLLTLVVIGLVKAGFFERKKKLELEALKEAENNATENQDGGEEWQDDGVDIEEVDMSLEQ